MHKPLWECTKDERALRHIQMQKALHYLVNSTLTYGVPDYDSANLILGLGGQSYDIRKIFKKSAMIRDEFDLLLRAKMQELGMDESWVLTKLKDAVNVAEEKMDAANMIKGVTEVGKLLRMYPDQKINQRGLTPVSQESLPAAGAKSLLEEMDEEQQRWQKEDISDAVVVGTTNTPDSTE